MESHRINFPGVRFEMKYFILVTGLFCVLFMGCEDDFDVFIPDDPSETITEPTADQTIHFFNAAQTPAQVFEFDAQTDALIRTSSNSYINIAASSLVNSNLELIEGTVTLEVIEVYNKGDFISFDVPTLSNTNLVDAAVVFHIGIKQEGEELFLKEAAALTIQSPFNEATAFEKMELFYGLSSSDNPFQWVEADNDSTSQNNVHITEFYDAYTQEWVIGYEFESLELGWVSCAAFAEPTSYSDLTVYLPEDYIQFNTIAYVVLENQNSVIRLPWSEEKNTFYSNYIPLDAAINVVLISTAAQDRFHFAQFSTMAANNSTIELTLEEQPLGDILEYLSGL